IRTDSPSNLRCHSGNDWVPIEHNLLETAQPPNRRIENTITPAAQARTINGNTLSPNSARSIFPPEEAGFTGKNATCGLSMFRDVRVSGGFVCIQLKVTTGESAITTSAIHAAK